MKVVIIKTKNTPYLNKYNLNIVLKFLFASSWRSAFVWFFVTLAFFVFGLVGAVVVVFIALTTMILKGIYGEIWKRENPGNKNI